MTCVNRPTCERCNKTIPVWFTDHWEETSPKEIYLCINCFLDEADKKGLDAMWRLSIEWRN